MADIHAARRARARDLLQVKGVAAALITSRANVRYLTGLVSSNAALLLPAGGPEVLATDSRYAETAARQCPGVELVIDRFIEPALASLAVARGQLTLGFEEHEMTVERHQALGATEGGLRLIPLHRAIEELRVVKDHTEIELLTRACAITSTACAEMFALIRPGLTERELAVALERAMSGHGAEALAFDTIVASGPNGAIPHHAPGDRPFAAGDLITIDCGARYAGYHADMTRTVALGELASWQREIYHLVLAAQQAGIAAARPGAELGTVDAAARDLIAEAGHREHFQHGLGHGVGLEVHEDPIIGYGRTGTLADRTPITVEPGIYLPGRGGVRIEDTLVVRAGAGAGGPADLLTTTTRELLVL